MSLDSNASRSLILRLFVQSNIGVQMSKKLLLVDDENQQDRVLRRSLREEGYSLDCVSDESTVLKVASQKNYALLILPWQLPYADGLSICRKLRAQGCATPILVLSSRVDGSKQILCLDSGADDYLTKPYDLRVLLARIRALIRRGTSSYAFARIGPLLLDRLDHCAKLEGRTVILSPREYSVLEYLVRESGRAVPRAELLSKAWRTSNAGSNVVDVQVKKLRKKLQKHARLIETVQGVGYRISCDDSTSTN